ncbi:MAG: COX15/CtaA family protein [Thermoanaerobaculia bacterium]
MTPIEPTPVWLRRFSKLVAASTLFLIFAGAMVTSTGSGLAVPDWPLSYGMLMPPMIGGIFYEHGHRMIAATVGLLTVIQALWLWRREPKRRVRMLGFLAVGAVIAQGVLGGLTVIFLLPHAISVAHAGLAEIFFCLNVSIAVMTSKWWSSARKPSVAPPTSAALVAIVYAQILIGAVMRHLQAGLAIPDFPLSFGKIVPPLTSAAIAVNYAHRVGAMIVAIAVITVASRLFAARTLRTNAFLLISIVILQICLGALTVWSGRQPVITSLHVMTGAATLALSLITALASRRLAMQRSVAPPAPAALVASEVHA